MSRFVATLMVAATLGLSLVLGEAVAAAPIAPAQAPDRTGSILVQRGHMVHARSMAISPDGQILITSGGAWGMSGSGDATVKVWDLDAGRLLRSIVTPYSRDAGYIESLSFVPGRRQFIASGRTGAVVFYDLDSGDRIQVLPAHEGSTFATVFDARGKLLTTGIDGKVRRWETGADGQWRAATERFELPTPGSDGPSVPYRSLAIHPDGTFLAAGSTEGQIDIWDAKTFQFLRRIDLGEGAVETAFKLTRMSFHPKKDILAVTLREKSIAFVNPRTGKRLPNSQPDPGIGYTRGAFYDPTGTFLAVLGEDHSVSLWHSEHHTELQRLVGHRQPVRNGVFTPDGERLVTTGFDSSLRVWDVERGLLSYTLEGYDRYRKREALGLDFSPDSRRIVVGTHDSRVLVWDLETGALAAETTGIDEAIGAVSYRPNGRELVVCDFNIYFFRWFPDSGRRSLLARGEFYSQAWSPDGSRLFAATKDLYSKSDVFHSSLMSFEMAEESTEVGKTVALGPSEVTSIAMKPSGDALAVSYRDGGIELRDPETLSRLTRFPESTVSGTVARVRFGWGGASLAALVGGVENDSVDRSSVMVWDLGRIEQPGLTHTVDHSYSLVDMAYHPVKPELACADGGNYEVLFLNTLHGQWEGGLPAQDALVTSLHYSPDGKYLALAKANDSVSIWDLEEQAPHLELHLLPERQWVVTRPGRPEYNATRDGDRYATLRLGTQLEEVYPLQHYRGALLQTNHLIRAWSAAVPGVEARRFQRWWEDALRMGRVAAVLRLGGYVFVALLSLISLGLGLRVYRNRVESNRLRESLYRQEQAARMASDRQNQALSLAKTAAESADRAKSTFLANLTHEIRTPLNAIVGFCQVLRRAQDVPQRHSKSLVTIERSSYHLLNLIEDVLDLSKMENGRMVLKQESFSLSVVLEDIIGMIQPSCQAKGLELRLEGVAGSLVGLPPRFLGDEGKLRQVLMNLLGNAVKFTDSGTITFRVSEVFSNGSAAARSETATYLFEIIDTGPGISSEDQKSLFTAFTQGEAGADKPGAGLGLAIAQRLLKVMGNVIQVDSKLRHGSRFSFQLVLSYPDKQTSVEADGAESSDFPEPVPSEAEGERIAMNADLIEQLRIAGRRCSLTQMKALLEKGSSPGVPEPWRSRWYQAAGDGAFDLILTDLDRIERSQNKQKVSQSAR